MRWSVLRILENVGDDGKFGIDQCQYINLNVKYKSTVFFLTKRSWCSRHSHCVRSASFSDASICQARASAKHVRLVTSTKREGPWERERMAKRRLSPFSLPFVLCARSCPSKKRDVWEPALSDERRGVILTPLPAKRWERGYGDGNATVHRTAPTTNAFKLAVNQIKFNRDCCSFYNLAWIILISYFCTWFFNLFILFFYIFEDTSNSKLNKGFYLYY